MVGRPSLHLHHVSASRFLSLPFPVKEEVDFCTDRFWVVKVKVGILDLRTVHTHIPSVGDSVITINTFRSSLTGLLDIGAAPDGESSCVLVLSDTHLGSLWEYSVTVSGRGTHYSRS